MLEGFGHPSVIILQNLIPGSEYVVSWRGAKPQPGVEAAQFRTIGTVTAKKLNLAVVSCNKVYFDSTGRADLWQDLAERAGRFEVDAVLHIGDQIYADSDCYFDENGVKQKSSDKSGSAYNNCLKLLENKPKVEWGGMQEELLGIYRAVYRTTWTKPSTALALASVANYMVLDDHEITDDWGDKGEDQEVQSMETDKHFVAQVGWQVWCEYQAQLYVDVPDFARGPDKAYIHHRIHDVGIILLDIRACKTFLKAPNCPAEKDFLGEAQWGAIEKVLNKGGAFDGVRQLVVCSPVPVAFLSPTMTATIATGSMGAADDLEGLWTGHGYDELDDLLALLLDWKRNEVTGPREVTIAAGDIHIGLTTDIYNVSGGRTEKVFTQLTTSAIHNSALPGLALNFIKMASTGLGNSPLIPEWEFDHTFFTQRNNYGLIKLEAAADKESKPYVRTSIVEDARGVTTDAPRVAKEAELSVKDNLNVAVQGCHCMQRMREGSQCVLS